MRTKILFFRPNFSQTCPKQQTFPECQNIYPCADGETQPENRAVQNSQTLFGHALLLLLGTFKKVMAHLPSGIFPASPFNETDAHGVTSRINKSPYYLKNNVPLLLDRAGIAFWGELFT